MEPATEAHAPGQNPIRNPSVPGLTDIPPTERNQPGLKSFFLNLVSFFLILKVVRVLNRNPPPIISTSEHLFCLATDTPKPYAFTQLSQIIEFPRC